jgi:hypothetical protein
VPSNKSFRFAVTGKDSVKQPSPGVVTAVKRKVQNGTIDGSGRIISQTYGPFPGQANAAITVDSGFSNVNYKPTNLYGSNMQFAKEHLDNYITQTQGFDYRIDCTYHAPSSSFRRNFTFVPVNLPSPPAFGDVSPISRFGADNLVFEYPGNVMNLSFDESAEDVATRFFVQYSKTDANGFAPFVGAANGQLLRDGWPLLDMAEKQDWPVLDVNNYRDKFPNMDLQDAFFRIGKRYLNESRPPIAAIQVTVNGSIVPEIGTYNPGDWCSLVIDDRFVLERLRSDLEPRNTALVRKIVAFSVSVPDGPASPESVTLSLLPEWEVDVYGE